MSDCSSRTNQRLAFAVTRFIEEVHRKVPQARLEPMTPYEDEDFTLTVIVPAGADEETILDQYLAASATIRMKWKSTSCRESAWKAKAYKNLAAKLRFLPLLEEEFTRFVPTPSYFLM